MRCIICDKCRKTIEEPSQVRIISCTRPIARPACKDTEKDGSDTKHRPPQDLIWSKELCVECALGIEDGIAGTKESPQDEEEP